MGNTKKWTSRIRTTDAWMKARYFWTCGNLKLLYLYNLAVTFPIFGFKNYIFSSSCGKNDKKIDIFTNYNYTIWVRCHISFAVFTMTTSSSSSACLVWILTLSNVIIEYEIFFYYAHLHLTLTFFFIEKSYGTLFLKTKQ